MEMTTLDELNAAIDRLEYLALARAENANDRNDARSAAERAHAAINALPGLIESARRVEELEAALKTIDRFSLIIEVGVRNTEPQFQPEIVAGLLKARAALKGT